MTVTRCNSMNRIRNADTATANSHVASDEE